MTNPPSPALVSKAWAADYISVSLPTIERLIAQGRLETVKLDPSRTGRRLVKMASLNRLAGVDDSASVA